MSVVVTVPLPDSKTGEPRILKTHLLDFVNISADEARRGGTVRYGIPRMLQPYLAASNRWADKAEVVCSMTSKYAIALYEMVQLRANMQRCTETFQIDRFRELLGVPPGDMTEGTTFRDMSSMPLRWKSMAYRIALLRFLLFAATRFHR